MEKIEFLILRNLLYNEEYTRKVLPFIKSEYFQDTVQKNVFEEIHSFILEYNKLPTKEDFENKTIELFSGYLESRAQSMEEQISKFSE